jgi:hypothetical protein
MPRLQRPVSDKEYIRARWGKFKRLIDRFGCESEFVAQLHRICPVREHFVGTSEIEATIAKLRFIFP